MTKTNLFLYTTAFAIISFGLIMPVNDANASENITESSNLKNVISDTAITAAVKTKFLADRKIKASDIIVETVNGKVFLAGSVEDKVTEDRVMLLAKNTNGVKEVDSKLVIMSNSSEKSESVSSNASNLVSDVAITTEIKSKYIADNLIKSYDINVETINGEVTLKGLVPTQEILHRANIIAKNVTGVKKVNSELSLK